MNWSKQGLVFRADSQFGWMNSHAQIPTVLNLGDRLRIYFATRPMKNESAMGFIEVDARDPQNLLYVHETPILEPGPAGSFDAHGIMPQSICKNGDEIWLYYCGWSRRTDVPYSNWTGLAISVDGGINFSKAFPGPIIDRTPMEIYSATGCCVRYYDERWHMWYAAGVDWIEIDGKLEEVYVVKYASSDDGLRWERENRQLLKSERDIEATHRPTVLKLGQRFHMWFCHRGVKEFRDGENSYRLGYAWSDDGRNWNREDVNAGLPPSKEGWDSKMIAYPHVVETTHAIYMFYNGSGFGASGFGYATLE